MKISISVLLKTEKKEVRSWNFLQNKNRPENFFQ